MLEVDLVTGKVQLGMEARMAVAVQLVPVLPIRAEEVREDQLITKERQVVPV